jgi:hypothetical protein
VNLATSVTAIVITAIPLLLVAFLGFRLALQQDQRRWLREKRADLYIDLLVEGYAEHNWVLNELTAMEIREIGDENGTDHDAGQRAVDDWRDRFGGLKDTRLPPVERAVLGARMSAFATGDVIRLFNAIGACSPLPPVRGEAAALKVRLAMAWDALEGGVRAELQKSQRTTWQRVRGWMNKGR